LQDRIPFRIINEHFPDLEDYIVRQKLRKAIQKVKEKRLEFKEGFSAEKVRTINREG
jgi:hypothetical protein